MKGQRVRERVLVMIAGTCSSHLKGRWSMPYGEGLPFFISRCAIGSGESSGRRIGIVNRVGKTKSILKDAKTAP